MLAIRIEMRNKEGPGQLILIISFFFFFFYIIDTTRRRSAATVTPPYQCVSVPSSQTENARRQFLASFAQDTTTTNTLSKFTTTAC